MNYLLAVASDVPVSVHEWSQTISIVTLLWALIGILGAIVVYYLLADRSGIKNTLDRLVAAVENLRLDLAENYVKKVDFEHLDRKVEKLREHLVVRGGERRSVLDGEDG